MQFAQYHDLQLATVQCRMPKSTYINKLGDKFAAIIYVKMFMRDKITRRDWGKIALAGVTGLMLPGCTNGRTKEDQDQFNVTLGVNSYSFRDRGLEGVIDAFEKVGSPSCELWQVHAEPPEMDALTLAERAALRIATPLEHYYGVREKFEKIGVPIQGYSIVFNDAQSDEEIEKAFQVAHALGVDTITTTATISVMPRVDVFAKKYKMPVGIHNHDKVEDPNAFHTPESFRLARKGTSDFIRLNLDIGHFVAANFDPVSFIKENHKDIVCLHIKDRERDHGPNVPFGEGNTPIQDVIRLLHDNDWKNIPANIEYEYNKQEKYKDLDPIVEVRKCLDYCRKALVAESSQS